MTNNIFSRIQLNNKYKISLFANVDKMNINPNVFMNIFMNFVLINYILDTYGFD